MTLTIATHENQISLLESDKSMLENSIAELSHEKKTLADNFDTEKNTVEEKCGELESLKLHVEELEKSLQNAQKVL